MYKVNINTDKSRISYGKKVDIMMGKFNFRGREITYSYEWLDDDTFVFQFGDGEFQDEDAAVIGDINNADDYITVEEMKMVMNFVKQFI